MTSQQGNAFNERNTRFVVRIRNHPTGANDSSRVISPKSGNKKLFSENQVYSCISNPKNNSIYYNDSGYSGKLLNAQNFGKDDTNNKVLVHENSEIFMFDKIHPETTK